MRVLALDPGGTTGWALFNNENLFSAGVIRNGLDGFRAWTALAMPTHTHLVVEDFVVEPGFVGRPEASEIIGAAFALSPAKKYRQLRSQKATLINGTEAERFTWLRERGFGGMTHELDAVTHALLFLRRMNHVPTIKKYWYEESPAD